MSDMPAVVDAPEDASAEEAADTNDRRTPRWFFEQCEARFGAFDLDAAANAENALCAAWLGEGGNAPDALGVAWTQWAIDNWPNLQTSAWTKTKPLQVWLNCPYGPMGTIPKWIAHARRQRDQFGTRTLMLLPADTSTEWFHDVSHTELCELVPFRLAFEAGDGSTKGNSAKFGSLLVWIAPKIQKKARTRVRKGRS